MSNKKWQHIRNTCNLGIGGRALVPILPPEIRKIVPAYSSTFHWLDKTYKFVNLFDESPDGPLVISNFIHNYLGNRDLTARRDLGEWLRTSKAPITIASTEQMAFRRFYYSDFYREILKPMGYHHSLYSGIKIGPCPIGILVLHRQLGERSFSHKDEKTLRELSPLIGEALSQNEGCIDTTLPSKHEIGLCLLDKKGAIQHISPQGRKLMLLAKHPTINRALPSSLDDKSLLPTQVISLVKQLYNALSDSNLHSLNAPRFEINSPWGKLLFQANWFQSPGNEEKSLIAVTVQYYEPSLYQASSKCEELDFTPRQAEITLSLLKGLSYVSISENLCLSKYTVNDYIKNVYQKLGIHNRGELLSSLLS